MTTSIKQDKGATIFLHLLFLHFIAFQILSILRATAIYNTSFLAVYSSLLISLVMVLFFMTKLNKVRFTVVEIILLFFPLIYFLFGFLINDSYRDLVADTYNALFFVMLIVYMRSQNINFDKELQIKFANWMFIGLVISTISYWVAPFIGFNVFSVGGTSIFFVFPLIVYLFNKQYLKFIIVLILLIIASKRGVLLGVLSVLLIVGFGNANMKPIVRALMVISVTMIFASIIFFTLSPDKFNQFPERIQPLLYKTMFVNPLSEYNRIESDARVREVIYAMKPLIDNPVLLITGMGAGYTYEYFSSDGTLIREAHKNVHFTPIAIFTRYGPIYTLIIYGYILSIIIINYRRLQRKKLSIENTILLFYLIAGLINSFTAYTIYLDYLFIMALGILTANIKRS
ncbi:hypothetical protein LGQ02_19545 [Bacillus shivajii]|uniref:hypothetical protein n=1 Tax=Bacillus shivajii TaxID=1983719 RepID=UPI001CF9E23B|nr:hypothetical protein [Bacillus shivajii]UCZ52948.1 hypothetical protein LGQ02_19545 [Bacillus shivajii]